MIVGISYAKEDTWQISRTRDYTPTYSPDEANYHSLEAREHSGGAKNYLRFIREELFPFLEKNYRADLSRKIYAGHSFGGLFGAYVLKAAPATFEHYVISDPSLWYDDKSVFEIKPEAGASTPKPVQVLIASTAALSGRAEGTLQMETNAKRLASMLREKLPADSAVTVSVFQDEIHETLFPLAISRGLMQFLAR